jgi:hypothetical protein
MSSPVRLTMDRHIHGVMTSDWSPGPFEGGLPLLTGFVILEFKFRSALPMLFKQVVQTFQLTPSSVSKYRRCLQAWSDASGLREAANA